MSESKPLATDERVCEVPPKLSDGERIERLENMVRDLCGALNAEPSLCVDYGTWASRWLSTDTPLSEQTKEER